jgi:kynurenine formamidase
LVRSGRRCPLASRFVLLSHPLRHDDPVWPGNPPAARIDLYESIERGDVANTTRLALFSHSGTHVDTPWHFDADGPAAWQLPVDRFVFEAPRLVDLALDPAAADGGFITLADLEPHADVVRSADLLLLRTGWGAVRDPDPRRYAQSGPMLHPDAARWLIDGHPGLRGVATDAISIGSPERIEQTIETHYALLGKGRGDGRFLLIFEDVRIVPEVASATRVFGWPLFIEGADGSPVTLVAEVPA